MYMESRTVGIINLSLAGIFFLYFTIIVIVLPFVESEEVKSYFPPVELMLGIPTLLGTVIILSLLARAYYLVRKDRWDEKNI